MNCSTRSTTSAATTKAHYEAHSADSYEQAQAFFFQAGGAYTKWLCQLVRDGMQLNNASSSLSSTGKQLLDIGGGTGSFTRLLVQDTNATAVVVDPFLEKSSSKSHDDDARVTFVCQPGEAFMKPPATNNANDSWRTNYDCILLKEAAHHFKDEDRTCIFRGMHQGFRRPSPTCTDNTENTPPSLLLLITRPQYDIDYPLWPEARQVWAEHQPSLEQFGSELQEAGFSDIQHTVEAYPCSVALEQWQSMIQARFWSTFSHFSNEELAEACERIAQDKQHRIKDGIIEFEDRLLFISAKKV